MTYPTKSAPAPTFSYHHYRTALWVDKWVIFLVVSSLAAGLYIAAFAIFIGSLPFWLINSPSIYLLRQTRWMRVWIALTAGLALLSGALVSKYPESSGLIAIVSVSTVMFLELLFDDEKRDWAYLLFGADGESSTNPEFNAARIILAKEAQWGEENDRMKEAMDLSNYQPAKAIEQIHNICEKGLNINALDNKGKTILDYACYIGCSPRFVNILSNMGAEKSRPNNRQIKGDGGIKF